MKTQIIEIYPEDWYVAYDPVIFPTTSSIMRSTGRRTRPQRKISGRKLIGHANGFGFSFLDHYPQNLDSLELRT